jgi:hypothetical protein
MYTIRSAAAQEALPLQRQLCLSDCDPATGRHLLEHLATRIGAFDGDTLVGLVRLLPLDRQERESLRHVRMEGPFTLPGHDCAAALHARVLQELGPKVDLWRHIPPPPVRPGEYTAASITVLCGLQAVRKRPGMYIGGVGVEGMREVLFEAISNTLDEHLAGHADALSARLDGDTWTIHDNGRGIPVTPLRDGQSALEAVMLTLSAGPYRGDRFRLHAHAGLRGLGLAVLNALTAVCVVEVERDGQRHRADFARGLPTAALHTIPPTGQRGTTLRFSLDPEIFGEATLTPDDLRPRLTELAGLNPGLAITLQGEHLAVPDGLLGLAEQAAGPLSGVRFFEAERDGVFLRAVLGWRSGPPLTISYCNQSRTIEGGSHVEGAHSGLSGLPEAGRVLLLDVRLAEPAFAGRTRDRLDMPALTPLIAAMLRDAPLVLLPDSSLIDGRVLPDGLLDG